MHQPAWWESQDLLGSSSQQLEGTSSVILLTSFNDEDDTACPIMNPYCFNLHPNSHLKTKLSTASSVRTWPWAHIFKVLSHVSPIFLRRHVLPVSQSPSRLPQLVSSEACVGLVGVFDSRMKV